MKINPEIYGISQEKANEILFVILGYYRVYFQSGADDLTKYMRFFYDFISVLERETGFKLFLERGEDNGKD